MITRIYIDNFRCFSNFEFKPARINLILGANGSGKTSMFEAVSGVVNLVVQGLDARTVFPTETLTRWVTRDEQRFELDVAACEGVYRYELVLKHDRVRRVATVDREIVTHDERTLFRYEDGVVHLHRNDGSEGTSFPFRGSRSFLAEIEEREETRDLHGLLSFFSDLWLLRLNPFSMEAASSAEAASLARDGLNFASWYRHVSQEDPERIAGFFASLREAVPGFRSLKLVSASARSRNRDLVVSFAQDALTYDVDFDELSDGQRALIVLYAVLLDLHGGRRTLLLDEPGNYVAPSEIQPWLLALHDALGNEGQLMVASHNAEAIDHLAAERPYWFERVDSAHVRVREAVFEREAGAKASEQVAMGAFDGE